jgi:hypothetical protein
MALVAMAAGGLSAQRSDSVRTAPHYWKKLALGAASSILLHETAHIATSVALGGHPTFGFDAARPTVYSGLDVRDDPRKQFVFSISGLVAQSLVDEAILDVPHARGGAFERGVLGGGIGTTIFYLTVGRRGSVSDVDFIARTRVMSKTEVTMLFGTIAAMHTWRVWRDPEYGNFFVRPRGAHAYDLGWSRRLAR